jgi:hypothetical protein
VADGGAASSRFDVPEYDQQAGTSRPQKESSTALLLHALSLFEINLCASFAILLGSSGSSNQNMTPAPAGNGSASNGDSNGNGVSHTDHPYSVHNLFGVGGTVVITGGNG